MDPMQGLTPTGDGRLSVGGVVFLVGLVGLVLCSSARAQEPPAAAPGGAVEKYTATYKLIGQFLEYRGRMAIVFPGGQDKSRLIRVTAEGEQLSFSRSTLHAAGSLAVNADTLLPQQGSRTIQSAALKEPLQVTLERVADYTIMSYPIGDQLRFRMTLPSEPRDPMSALFALRALPLEEGDIIEMIVGTEINGFYIWFNKARFEVNRERLTTATGSYPAWRVRGHLDRRGAPLKLKHPLPDFQFWLHDNANREVLRIAATLFGLSLQLDPATEVPSQLVPRRRALPGVTMTRARSQPGGARPGQPGQPGQ